MGILFELRNEWALSTSADDATIMLSVATDVEIVVIVLKKYVSVVGAQINEY